MDSWVSSCDPHIGYGSEFKSKKLSQNSTLVGSLFPLWTGRSLWEEPKNWPQKMYTPSFHLDGHSLVCWCVVWPGLIVSLLSILIGRFVSLQQISTCWYNRHCCWYNTQSRISWVNRDQHWYLRRYPQLLEWGYLSIEELHLQLWKFEFRFVLDLQAALLAAPSAWAFEANRKESKLHP
jgi:hypothetical protein